MAIYLKNLADDLERIAVLLERIIADLKQIRELQNAAESLKLTLGTPVQQ